MPSTLEVQSDAHSKRILIVDNDPNMLILLRDTLDEYENLRAASSGMEAVCLARQWRPDLIILDIQMPALDGLATCEVLRANSQLTEVPIIFLTSRRDSQTVVKCFKVGGNEFIAKPFRRWELLLRVEEQLAK